MKPTVYLSGPITGLTYERCTDWRVHAVTWFKARGIVGVSPMRGETALLGQGAINDGMTAAFINTASSDRAIITRNRYDTTKADFVLVNLLGATRASIGTMVEMAWADMARVPVVTVMEPKGSIHEHALVRELSGYRCDTLQDGLDLIALELSHKMES